MVVPISPRMAVIAAAVTVAVAVAMSNEPDDEVAFDRLKESYYPALSDFAAIAMPVERPPAGAALKASSQVGTDFVTQQMMFQYNGYTVTACSVEVRASAFDPCALPPGETLRVADSRGWRTRYSVSSKYETGARGTGPGSVIDVFERVDLVTRPGWVRSYADAYVKELYG